MGQLRTILFLMVYLFACMGTLTACGTTTSPTLLSANSIAQYVGAHYNDPHMHIYSVISTRTDPPPHDPMYVIKIRGHFQKGALIAYEIGFSALADRMYVWGARAFDQSGKAIWFDRDLSGKG